MLPILQLIEFLLGQPPDTATQRTEALAIVDRWMKEHGSEPVQWCCPRAEFADRVATLIRESWRLRQGGYGWCMPAAFLNCIIRRFPVVFARYATSLYDTGAAQLGSLALAVKPSLRQFDVLKYVDGQLPDHPLDPNRTKEIKVSRTDWILLSALQDKVRGGSVFEGPIDGPGSEPAFTNAACVQLFQGCALYTTVKEVSFAGANAQSASTLLAASSKTDIVFVGNINAWATVINQPQPFALNGRHAVALLNKPFAANNQMTYRFSSWGDQESVLPFVTSAGGLRVFSMDGDFGASGDIDDAIVATVA
jgi:hypothetical protein